MADPTARRDRRRRSHMKLAVDRLTATPEPLAFEAPASWWEARVVPGRDLDELVVTEPFHFELAAHAIGQDVFLEGRVRGAVEVPCGRCLERYRHALSEDFRLVLEPAGERTPADPEGAAALARDGLCLGEDLELGWYRGDELDLEAFFSELVSLDLPMQPLCSEDCAGLCPTCGANRNQDDCRARGCVEKKPESPFAVLAALRDSSQGDG